ncbi:FecR domain-containing protein [Pseudomonas sp. PDM16]|uniref:FecR family protein n=1 Tax=Pseudomonas sp. PDM16 TaxID=2769292 RepID=UPI00177DA48F|nr:FecR domain-containing protein [Pseudomonas sp. PDM16]MBD9416632.1 FecR domain-containing protein [Pseudomonas sp. PDM16]
MSSIHEQAADWLLRLDEDQPSDTEHARFEAWCKADPRHAEAVERMRGFVGQLQGLRDQRAPAHAALNAAFASRRLPRGKRGASALLLALALFLPAALAWRGLETGHLMADLDTAPGQWRSQVLSDQSHITLGGNSALDVRFDTEQRRINLLRGEVLVEVAHDAARPFIVATEQGEIRALGTRFVVRNEGDSTLLLMLESRVAAHGSRNPAITQIQAGQQARILLDGVEPLPGIDNAMVEDAWRNRQLVIQDQPLALVLDELARQRQGYLHYDAEELADLRISAVLPLDDSERALQLIGEALPIQVRQVTPWLLLVERH